MNEIKLQVYKGQWPKYLNEGDRAPITKGKIRCPKCGSTNVEDPHHEDYMCMNCLETFD